MTLQKAHHLINNVYLHKKMWDKRKYIFINENLRIHVKAIEKKGKIFFEAVHFPDDNKAVNAFTTHFIMPEKYDDLLLVLRTLQLI